MAWKPWLDEISPTGALGEQYYFDEQAAEVAVRFFRRVLRHTKGEWMGQPFNLLPWQEKVIRDVFGWKRKKDGTRRFREVYVEVPRKNGKSELAAGVALYLLFMDGEPAAEIYSAAADEEQAAIVFQMAKTMVEMSDVLERRSEVYKRSIVVPATGSVYRVLSSEAYTKHGINAHGIVFDELHAQPNRELWDVLTTSTGARRQPLIWSITTAGWDRESICWEQHEYAERVLKGIVPDDAFYPVIFKAEDDDDWTDERAWAKANPSLGHTVKLDYLRREAMKALQSPAYQNTFRRLHLNQWTAQAERWLPMEDWDQCATPVDEKTLEGRVCFGGLDLATTVDIAAFVLVFPPEKDGEPYWVVPRFWVPEENMEERARKDRVPYPVWARRGYITATPGEVIDFRRIVVDIEELGKQFRIKEIAFDRWGAIQVSQELEARGFEMVQFGQGFRSMSPPTKELLRLVKEKRLAHGGHPVLRWMADNLVVDTDAAGNVKPNKKKSREKIDGMVALIMALDRAMRHGLAGSGSVYDQRGIRTL